VTGVQTCALPISSATGQKDISQHGKVGYICRHGWVIDVSP
jgi:hypothetical protein